MGAVRGAVEAERMLRFLYAVATRYLPPVKVLPFKTNVMGVVINYGLSGGLGTTLLPEPIGVTEICAPALLDTIRRWMH